MLWYVHLGTDYNVPKNKKTKIDASHVIKPKLNEYGVVLPMHSMLILTQPTLSHINSIYTTVYVVVLPDSADCT